MTRLKNAVIIITILACLAAGLISLNRGEGFFGWFTFLINRDTRPVLFIVLMAVMPIIGFPLSVFLVLAGVKFGIAWGFLLAGFTMAIHITLSYLLAHSVFKPYLDGLLGRYWEQLRAFWKTANLFQLFIFAVIPGLPYAVKNYALSLSGLSFPVYFAVGWTTQLIMALPFVVLGRHAAKMNLHLVFVILLILLILYLFLNWLYRRQTGNSGALFAGKGKNK